MSMSTGTGHLRRLASVVHPMEGQEGLTVSAVVLAPDDAALVRVHDVPGGVGPGLQVVDLKLRRPRHHHPQHCSDHHLHSDRGATNSRSIPTGRWWALSWRLHCSNACGAAHWAGAGCLRQARRCTVVLDDYFCLISSPASSYPSSKYSSVSPRPLTVHPLHLPGRAAWCLHLEGGPCLTGWYHQLSWPPPATVAWRLRNGRIGPNVRRPCGRLGEMHQPGRARYDPSDWLVLLHCLWCSGGHTAAAASSGLLTEGTGNRQVHVLFHPQALVCPCALMCALNAATKPPNLLRMHVTARIHQCLNSWSSAVAVIKCVSPRYWGPAPERQPYPPYRLPEGIGLTNVVIVSRRVEC